MEHDKAWLAIWKDISREDTYVVWLNKHTAEENVAEGIGTLAKHELETIEWDEEDSSRLQAIVDAAASKRWNEVLSEWDEWRSDKGPLDDDVELIEVYLET